VSSAVVAACDGSEPLLSCRVPLLYICKHVVISDCIANTITVSDLYFVCMFVKQELHVQK
jgi:hypothetical protein